MECVLNRLGEMTINHEGCSAKMANHLNSSEGNKTKTKSDGLCWTTEVHSCNELIHFSVNLILSITLNLMNLDLDKMPEEIKEKLRFYEKFDS